MALKSDENLKKNCLTVWKMTRNLANFNQSTWKCQTWEFNGIESMSLTFSEELCIITMKNDSKLEKELTSPFKIDMMN